MELNIRDISNICTVISGYSLFLHQAGGEKYPKSTWIDGQGEGAKPLEKK